MRSLYSLYEKIKARLNGQDRPLIDEVLKSIQDSNNHSKPFLYIVKAPTGYGKTVISISCAIYTVFDSSLFPKVVHVLPMRSIVEDVHSRATKILGEAVKSKMMDVKEDELEVFHLFPLNVTTVDTFTWDILKLNTKKLELVKEEKAFGYDFLTQGSLLDSLLFFDEAHYILEDENMKIAFSTVLELILKYKTSFIISTATLSKGYEEYFEKMAKDYGYDFIVFQPDDTDPFIKRESSKDFDIQLVDNGEKLERSVKKLIDPNSVNLIVVNSPYTSVRLYNMLSGFNGYQVFLLHGNMKKSHRLRVLDNIKGVTKKKIPSIIITTQVIEAGVDISSDVLITEVSVAQSLLQRMGRVARYYDEKSARIYIFKSSGEPYPNDKIQKTWAWLKENVCLFHPRIPSSYYDLLNEVHGKYLQQVKPVCPNTYKCLKIKLLDLRTRSFEMLGQIEKILKERPFLREFTIPVKVDDEYILFSPREADKMFKNGLIEVEIDGESVSTELDFDRIAKKMAIESKSVEVVYRGEYDDERGIVP